MALPEMTSDNQLSATDQTANQKLQVKHLLYVAMGLAVILRLGLAIAMPTDQSKWEDEWNYHSMAESFANGQGYTLDGETPTRMRTPGYPTVLGIIYYIFGPNPQIALYFQTLWGALNVLFVYLIAQRVFDQRTSILSAFIVATYPALIFYDIRILREGLTTLLITGSLTLALAFSHKRPPIYILFGTGMLIAFASMTRPETLLLTAPIGYILVRPITSFKNIWRPALILSLPILLLWVPWTIRNYNHFGTLSPVTKGLGSVLWFGSRWAAIDGDNHKQKDRVALQKENTNKYAGLGETEQEHRYMQDALKDIKQKPEWFLNMVFKKMELFWRDANGVKKTLPKIHPALPYLLNTYYYSLLLLALSASVWLCRKQEWVLPLFGTILTYMMIYAILHVRNRYRVPILPIVFVLSAGGFWALFDLIKYRLLNRASTSH